MFIAESVSENFYKSVNIWHSYGKRVDCVMHSEVGWPGTQSAQHNHVLVTMSMVSPFLWNTL